MAQYLLKYECALSLLFCLTACINYLEIQVVFEWINRSDNINEKEKRGILENDLN